ncbi:transient receptor potential cation channel subfamily A member 1-like [Papaver somniferum]|uniref:transient receptor potential cation channel subfamily A member 1-like n=1 Tax=Papaver somniferum TaxID=3469 RepID=UPI000E7060A3|nr:transient receptor potential cation channel subfamily A member 1-like [Papaver somniferum]
MESLSIMWNQLQNMFSNEKDSRLDNLDETFTSFRRTPLHIAAMSGDVKFASRILSKVEGLDLALKQDSNGFTPLHLASVRTSIPMVRLLLEAKSDACIVQDEDGRTPLHLAAMKNQGEVMKVLMEEGLPEAIHLRNHRNGETILHFCVKNNTNLKTLKLLVNKLVHAPVPEQNPNLISVDSTDNGGNTILHFAAKMGNMKVTNYLLLNSNVRIDINVVNNKGLKALNMLRQGDRNDLQFGFYDYHVYDKHMNKTLSRKNDLEGRKDRVNALMVVATLIAGIAFAAAMNPPGGVWQEDSKIDSGTDPVTFVYYLDQMFSSSISGGLDKYITDSLQYRAVSNFSRIGEEEVGAYPIIRDYVNTLWNLYFDDPYYSNMISQGLILEDFMFRDFVSYYNYSTGTGNIESFSSYKNSTRNGTRVGFFPYLIRYAGTPILAYTWPDYYVIYMVTNGVALFVSLTIIFLVICGFMIEKSVTQVRVLVVLMCISIGFIATSYLTILAALLPGFFNIFNGYYEIFVLQVFFGVCSLLGIIWFFVWTAWKIAKLRKKMRHHHIGVINYLKTLFYSMDAKTAGKLCLFIISYCAFRLNGYLYNNFSWSYINPFLY